MYSELIIDYYPQTNNNYYSPDWLSQMLFHVHVETEIIFSKLFLKEEL